MNLWPREGGPAIPDGPRRFAFGPKDHDGLGREAFWDQTPEERAAILKEMVDDAGVDLTRRNPAYWPALAERRDFAKGWLAENYRLRKATSPEQKP